MPSFLSVGRPEDAGGLLGRKIWQSETQMISDVQIFPSRVLQLCDYVLLVSGSTFFGGPELQQGFDMQRWHLIFISFDIPKKIPGLNGCNIISWDFMGFDIPQKTIYTRLSRTSPQDYVQHRSSLVGVVCRRSESLRQPQGKDLKMMNSSPELDCPKSPGCDEKLSLEFPDRCGWCFWNVFDRNFQ